MSLMASLAMDIADGCDDYLPLPPVEEEDADDDGYLPLPPVEEEDVDEYMQDDDDEEEDEDGEGRQDMQLGSFSDVLRHALVSYRLADIIPRLPVVAAAPDDTAMLAEALKTADAPSDGSDCPICMDDGEGAWKETPCGHRFHGRCVERWLHEKGTCPLCRRQLTTPTDNTQGLLVEMEVIYQEYGPDVAMEVQSELLL